MRFKEFGTSNLEIVKFNEVVESTLYGPRFNSNDYDLNGNVKTIRGTDISANGTIKYDQVPIASIDSKVVETHKLGIGDIVMITTADCGMSGVFESQKYDFIASAYAVRIRLNNKAIPNYYKYYFQTWHSKKKIHSYVRKATVANLPGADILKVTTLCPSLPEQQKIADFLTIVDKKIQALEKKKALLEQYKKGVMQKIFKQEIRFKQEDGSDYPEWEEKRLGELAIVTMGQSPSSTSYNNENLGVPLIQGNADIIKRKTEPRQYTTEPTKKIAQGELIMTVRAPSGYIAKSYHNACIGRGVCSIGNSKGNLNYLYYYLLWFEPRWMQFEQGSTFTAISGNDIRNLLINAPKDNEEQTNIANFLTSIDNKLNSVLSQIDKTKMWKKGLLQQMFV